MKNRCESMMLCCFDFLLCFSHELGRSRWSRYSRAFVKTVNELLHIQFQWILTDKWLIQKLEKNLSSLKSKILIIRCDCLVVVCGPGGWIFNACCSVFGLPELRYSQYCRENIWFWCEEDCNCCTFLSQWFWFDQQLIYWSIRINWTIFNWNLSNRFSFMKIVKCLVFCFDFMRRFCSVARWCKWNFYLTVIPSILGEWK